MTEKKMWAQQPSNTMTLRLPRREASTLNARSLSPQPQNGESPSGGAEFTGRSDCRDLPVDGGQRSYPLFKRVELMEKTVQRPALDAGIFLQAFRRDARQGRSTDPQAGSLRSRFEIRRQS